MIKIMTFFAFIFWFQVCFAVPEVKTNSKGVVSIEGRARQLNLYHSYAPIFFNDGVYILGRQLDKENKKRYVISFISTDMETEVYWDFSNVLLELFLYKENIYVLDGEGFLFSLKNGSWQKSEWKFPRYSSIIYSEKFLIVCYGAPPLGLGSETGGCLAPERKWAFFELLEYTTLPRICDNKIVLRRTSGKRPFFFVRYNMETGQKETEKKINGIDDDLCAIKFE